MKELIKFELSGKSAFFKKSMTNNVCFSYNNIHPIVLRGLLGAIIGLEGYSLIGKSTKAVPNFYTELKNLQIGIVPIYKDDTFSFPINPVTFTHTTGLASQDGTLIVNQNWLLNPKWEIYLSNNGLTEEIWNKLKEYLGNNQAEFIPYLGSNDHIARIKNIEFVNGVDSESDKIDSLFYVQSVEETIFKTFGNQGKKAFFENMPVSLCEESGTYKSKLCYFTERTLKDKIKTIKVDNKEIFML